MEEGLCECGFSFFVTNFIVILRLLSSMGG